MIRLATTEDLPTILELVEEAKALMKQDNNHQWDDAYPLEEHFEEDIEKETLYVLDIDQHIYGFIVIDRPINLTGMIRLIGRSIVKVPT